MEPSDPYVFEALVFAIKDSYEILPVQLLAPFQRNLWMTIVFIWLLNFIIILLTKYLPSYQRHYFIGGYLNRTPLLRIFNIYLGGSISIRNDQSKRKISIFSKTMLITWIIGFLIIRGAYQGSLYEFLQRQDSSSPYDTIQKVFDSDCDVHVMHTALTSLRSYPIEQNR